MRFIGFAFGQCCRGRAHFLARPTVESLDGGNRGGSSDTVLFVSSSVLGSQLTLRIL